MKNVSHAKQIDAVVAVHKKRPGLCQPGLIGQDDPNLVLGFVDHFACRNPWHHVAQFTADNFDLVFVV